MLQWPICLLVLLLFAVVVVVLIAAVAAAVAAVVVDDVPSLVAVAFLLLPVERPQRPSFWPMPGPIEPVLGP